MPHWNNQRWQRNFSKTASGKPGAVESRTCEAFARRGKWKAENNAHKKTKTFSSQVDRNK
jgi:hypothetical protein